MTRTTITILTFLLMILTVCWANHQEEQEEEGAVRLGRETHTGNRMRRGTQAGKKKMKNIKRKKGRNGRKKGNTGRKKINSGRKKGMSGRRNGNTGRKKGNSGSKKEMSDRKKVKIGRKKGGAGRKKVKAERKKVNKKSEITSEKETEINNRKLVSSPRKEMKFTHCQYLDLTEIGLRNDSACEAGSKFLFKAVKGHRRQFLMTNTSNIVVFLKHRHKITNCTELMDITDKVKCKAVAGVKSLDIPSPIGGCLKSCGPEFLNIKPSITPGNATAMGSATTVFCPCPERRTFVCSTKIVSTGNMHTITCNNMASVTVSCGSDLVGAKNVLGLSVDYYKHKLCSTKEYKSILIDYTWRCKDRVIPVPASPWCKGDPVPAPTTAPITLETTSGATASTTPAPTTTMVSPGPGRRRGRGALSSGRLV